MISAKKARNQGIEGEIIIASSRNQRQMLGISNQLILISTLSPEAYFEI
jgi:hypothetical protein